jgi:methyl-accepting chemotaxis protein
MALRMSLKWRPFFGTLIIAALILGMNYFYTQHILRKTSRVGAFMKSNFDRYIAYQKAHSIGIQAAVDIWSTSLRMRTALSTTDPAALAKTGSPSREALLREVIAGITRVIDPKFILILDGKGEPLEQRNSPFKPTDLHANALIGDVLQGKVVSNVILEHEHTAWLIDAAPVYQEQDRSSRVVGAVVVGSPLLDLFREYSRESDLDPKNRFELALINNQTTLASTMDVQLDDDLASATQQIHWQFEEEGGEKVPVVKVAGSRYNYFEGSLRGYSGSTQGTVGKLSLLRNRAMQDQRAEEIGQSTVVLFGVALVIAGLVSWVLSIMLSRPLRQFIIATRELAQGQGDLTQRLEVDSSATEMIELADNLNALFANLHRLASEVQAASFQVGASSAEISAASKQMLGGASDQAQKIVSSTAAVTELSSSIQQVAENAVQATKVAKESGEKMDSGIGKLASTSSLIEETSEKIQALGQSGKRIGNIVEVIRQISEQTSLLALNASIEAAHAGEQGRGFAVVADEVSSLARRVGQSAKDIEGLIATITEQTGDAVQSMSNVTRAFGEYTMGSTYMQSALKQIVDVIQDTARSVQEQAVVSDEIARNMDAVQKIAHEVLGSSEEAVVQGEQLHSLALRLEQLVRGFRIEHEAQGGNGASESRALPKGAAAALPEKSSERRKVARG